jgi:hypothetical protein
MIASLTAAQAKVPTPAARPLATEQPAPTPAPPPNVDTLDFSKLDSPVKAALLPVNEPAVQLATVAGVIFAIMAGAQQGGGAAPLISIDLASKSGEKLMNVSYQIDMKNPEAPFTGSGTVDGQEYNDGLALSPDQKSAGLVGNVGANKTSLMFGLDQASQSLTLSGKLGDVDESIKFSPIMDAKQNPQGLHLEGNIGGEAYSADYTLDGGAEGVMSGDSAKMSVRGKLGNDDINKDYVLTAKQNPTGITLSINGTGTTAGVSQQVSVDMNLVG